MEAAVGERTAQALMKEEEQQSNLDAFCREAVGIVSSVPLQQAVSLELAQIVAQLVQAIALLREPEASWVSLAVQPPTCGPPCKRTSISLMTRVSWILMPG